MTKMIHFCTMCKNEVRVAGWGNRAECPRCEKIVPIKSIRVKDPKAV